MEAYPYGRVENILRMLYLLIKKLTILCKAGEKELDTMKKLKLRIVLLLNKTKSGGGDCARANRV
jgi:hypothetical protein